MKILKTLKLLTFIAIVLNVTPIFAQATKFKVVLDAGHGGHDFGAGYHGLSEKTIALAITLKVGSILEKNPNIDVIYTRDTDTFVELNKRAEIANSNKASIFVSIHCNANKNTSAEGYETYVMGVHRNASNLEVAKSENQVVTMEKDYKLKYNGYDPKNPETAIGTTLLQEEYMDNSITLASRVQNGMATNFGRKDRRVKQAGFLVLREIYMPRILIEMGFISNEREGNYMNSEAGQAEISAGIASAIVSYKNEFYGSGKNEPQIEKYVATKPEKQAEKEVSKEVKNDNETEISSNSDNKQGIIFKVQIAASGKKLDLTPGNFKGLDNISVATDGGALYKYMYGNTASYSEAKENLTDAKNIGFTGAYIIAFKDGIKISLQEALK